MWIEEATRREDFDMSRHPALHHILGLWVGVVSLLVGGVCHAGDPAVAEALFREGKRLMEDGRYEAACAKFSASHDEDASVGTLLNLARCNEKRGKTATAWAEYQAAASLARKTGDDKREAIASELAGAIEATLSRLTITVPVVIDGLEVRRNGVAVPAAVFGIAVAIDPGVQQIEARAPGHAPWSKTVTITPGDRREIAVPALELERRAPDPDEQAPDTVVIPAPLAPDEGEPSYGLLYGGVAVGVLGLAGLGAGIGLGLSAASDKDDALARCPDGACDDESFAIVERARTKAHGATAGFVVGGVALTAGVVMMVLGADASAPESGRFRLPLFGCSFDGCAMAFGGAF